MFGPYDFQEVCSSLGSIGPVFIKSQSNILNVLTDLSLL